MRPTDIDRDLSPFAPAESEHAERTAREVTDHDREPDVRRLQPSRRLKRCAEPDGHQHLRGH